MTPDHANAVFEFLGSLLTWMNVRRVYRDKGHAGLFVPAIVFFFAWGFWNCFYYPYLHQWWSFTGGVSLVAANLAWVVLLLYYGPITSKEW